MILGLYKDYMYIFGGLNGKTKTHFNDLYRYSIKGNFWEYLNVHGVGPCKRRRQACLIYKDKVYLFGGTRLVNISFKISGVPKS